MAKTVVYRHDSDIHQLLKGNTEYGAEATRTPQEKGGTGGTPWCPRIDACVQRCNILPHS
jgi:hypothetical protein